MSYETVNPATGEHLASFTERTSAQVEAALNLADERFSCGQRLASYKSASTDVTVDEPSRGNCLYAMPTDPRASLYCNAKFRDEGKRLPDFRRPDRIAARITVEPSPPLPVPLFRR